MVIQLEATGKKLEGWSMKMWVLAQVWQTL